MQLGKKNVSKWSRPVFDAYLAGAWILYWTDKTLYWVAKPTVHTEMVNGRKQLHRDDGPTLECDVENLYFIHGVMVPAFVVTHPDWITVRHIDTETNAEVRRVMVDRYGPARYLIDSKAEKIHQDDWGTLYVKEMPGDEKMVFVDLVNSTLEPDGSAKRYMVRVHPELRPMRDDKTYGEPQQMTALNAVASTHGMAGREYAGSMMVQT